MLGFEYFKIFVHESTADAVIYWLMVTGMIMYIGGHCSYKVTVLTSTDIRYIALAHPFTANTTHYQRLNAILRGTFTYVQPGIDTGNRQLTFFMQSAHQRAFEQSE